MAAPDTPQRDEPASRPAADPDGTPKSSQRDTTARRRDQLAEPSGEAPSPRLPHERDESGDSQALDHEQGQRDVMRQAGADLERGLKDTDRKAPMDRAYEQQKGAGAPGTAPAAPDLSGAGKPRDGR